MNQNVDIKKMSDLELAEIYGQVYQQLMIAQQNMQAIQGEIRLRKEVVGKKESEKKPSDL